MATVEVKGGEKAQRVLEDLAQRIGSGGAVSIGFFAGANYPTKAKEQLFKRSLSKKLKKRLESIAATSNLDVATVAFWNEFGTHRKSGKQGSPPRPFFRKMIAEKSPEWGDDMARIFRAVGFKTPDTLKLMGELIQGELRQSIVDLTDPPNAQYTVEKKGFNKPLIETGIMLRAVAYKVNLRRK